MKLPPPGATGHAIPEERAAQPKRKRCKNCPRFFTRSRRAGSPQLFCSENCRKEFHRNGAAFGALRDKLPGYIDKAVAKHLGRPTEDEFQELAQDVRTLTATATTFHSHLANLRVDLMAQIERVEKLVAQLRTDFEAHKEGL